jgi:hypothetical protein
MSLYCDGKGCPDKENCYRHTELKNQQAKGFENGVWITNKDECETNRSFFYTPISKVGNKN